MYMFVIVYLLFVFANELLINALWRGGGGEGKKYYEEVVKVDRYVLW